jgi:hypothetical protein
MAKFLETLKLWWETGVPLVQDYWLAALLSLLFVYVFWKLAWWLGPLYLEIKDSSKRVFIEVTMPREESQKDKENATDKDFKEKIAIMDQLFRGLHEIRELDLTNRILVWFTGRHSISFEIHAKYKEVTFYGSIHPYYSEILEKQITSYYPNAGIEYAKPKPVQPEGLEKPNTLKGAFLFLKKDSFFPIRTFKNLENDPLNDLTNVLSKLKVNERSVIQIMIRPKNSKWQEDATNFGEALFKGEDPKKKGRGILRMILSPIGWLFSALLTGVENADKTFNAPGDEGGGYVRMLSTKEELAKRIGEKSGQVGFDTVIRIIASSDEGEKRCDEILNGIFVGFNATKDAASNWFESRRLIFIDSINTPILMFGLKNRLFRFFEKQSLMTPEELASIFHFPTTRYNYTPAIKWLPYKILPGPIAIDESGILLGMNKYRGVEREIRFGRKDRRRHHYCIGQTGTGKSAFISYIARQDIQRGDGVCVIDPHGDLIEDILQYVPKERAKDVIVFDPADMERPMGLNLLEAQTPEQQDMASSQATEIFIKIFGDEIFGPRIQHYFRNACLTLMEDKDEGATLIDVPRIFTDDEFMRYKSSKVKNPVVKSFWDHEYANTGDRERQEMIPYFSSKFGPFISNAIMRNTIGQAKSAFNVRECMDERKILLINLSKGKLGTLNTQLLGLVIVAQIQMAAMSRVDTPEDERPDFYLYVDEFQNFATDTFCSILSEARKYHLNLIMAHQYINQLVGDNGNSEIRDAVFGNVGTLQTFKVGADDAEYFAKEYAPVLTEQDIIGIPNYKAYLKLNVNSVTSRPFSMDTIWDPSGANPKIREIVKKYSRMKYGRKRLFVEQEIASRIGIELDALGTDDKDTYTSDKPEAKKKVGEKGEASPVDLSKKKFEKKAKIDVKASPPKTSEKVKLPESTQTTKNE